MKEIWKDIKGFEGLYQVSNLGNIRSLDKYVNNRFKNILRKGKILKPSKKINGYLQVVLVKNGKRYTKTVHRLVAETFIPNPKNYPVINHKNECKSDNNVLNLEWCTISYNTRYSCGVEIEQYDLNHNFIKKWNDISEACEKLKISNTNINNCLHNRNKTAGGFIWRYAND